jgi:hypothetical protein
MPSSLDFLASLVERHRLGCQPNSPNSKCVIPCQIPSLQFSPAIKLASRLAQRSKSASANHFSSHTPYSVVPGLFLPSFSRTKISAHSNFGTYRPLLDSFPGQFPCTEFQERTDAAAWLANTPLAPAPCATVTTRKKKYLTSATIFLLPPFLLPPHHNHFN